MRFLSFSIKNYRAINKELVIRLDNNKIVPLIGVNECGKTTILQAIFAFDSANDASFEGRHLINTKNLYTTSVQKDPIITAEIEISYKYLLEIIEEYNSDIDKKTDEESADPETSEEIVIAQKIDLKLKKKDFKDKIKISRNLNSMEYIFSNKTLSYLNPIAEDLVNQTPYILYNDDFMERPPNFIEIPLGDTKPKSEWYNIFNKLFEYSTSNRSLQDLITMDDSRDRNSLLSDVQIFLNKKLMDAWRKFSPERRNILKVHLELEDNSNDSSYPKKLTIQIKEEFNNKERYFNIEDRSKGFLWFFNFVMKLEFNPKAYKSKDDTIYLLDEPGSYLHSAAQEILCSKLQAISKTSGGIIYCTHSHHLLLPNFIPFNNIKIISKGKNKEINATLINSFKRNKMNTNAYQPIMDALQIPVFDIYNDETPMIAVEGIYDKYAIELFANLDFQFNILPGTSADSIIKNIQYLIAFSKNYIAIWDNDKEGIKKFNEANKIFGPIEAEKFDKLPLKNKAKRKMEQMFSNDDLNKIKESINLTTGASYEKTLIALYQSSNQIKRRVNDELSEETKENFADFKKIIKKKLKLLSI